MNSNLGLQARDWESIEAILSQHPEVEEAIVFGSRAKGNYSTGSDVDIALKGETLDPRIISSIAYQLNEETNMPYRFDVVNYHTVQSESLLHHVDRVGIIVFQKQGATR